jgi:hypothetical protein
MGVGGILNIGNVGFTGGGIFGRWRDCFGSMGSDKIKDFRLVMEMPGLADVCDVPRGPSTAAALALPPLRMAGL